jgi:hypothetical protein
MKVCNEEIKAGRCVIKTSNLLLVQKEHFIEGMKVCHEDIKAGRCVIKTSHLLLLQKEHFIEGMKVCHKDITPALAAERKRKKERKRDSMGVSSKVMHTLPTSLAAVYGVFKNGEISKGLWHPRSPYLSCCGYP